MTITASYDCILLKCCRACLFVCFFSFRSSIRHYLLLINYFDYAAVCLSMSVRLPVLCPFGCCRCNRVSCSLRGCVIACLFVMFAIWVHACENLASRFGAPYYLSVKCEHIFYYYSAIWIWFESLLLWNGHWMSLIIIWFGLWISGYCTHDIKELWALFYRDKRPPSILMTCRHS